MVGRKLARVALAVYGAPCMRDVPLSELPWVGWDSELQRGAIAEFRQRYSPNQDFEFYANSMMVVVEAARKAGVVTVLDCLTGDADPSLVRLTKPVVTDTPLWLLTHPDLQRSPRVRTLMDYVAGFVAASSARLLGETAEPA